MQQSISTRDADVDGDDDGDEEEDVNPQSRQRGFQSWDKNIKSSGLKTD